MANNFAEILSDTTIMKITNQKRSTDCAYNDNNNQQDNCNWKHIITISRRTYNQCGIYEKEEKRKKLKKKEEEEATWNLINIIVFHISSLYSLDASVWTVASHPQPCRLCPRGAAMNKAVRRQMQERRLHSIRKKKNEIKKNQTNTQQQKMTKQAKIKTK